MNPLSAALSMPLSGGRGGIIPISFVQVDIIGGELRKATRPDRTDERAFYMNLAMNGLTKSGYEFAGISNDEIVMKRALTR